MRAMFGVLGSNAAVIASTALARRSTTGRAMAAATLAAI